MCEKPLTVFADFIFSNILFYIIKPNINNNERRSVHLLAFNSLLYSVITFPFRCIL